MEDMLKFILSLLLILNLSCKSSSVGTPTEKSNPGGEQANAGNDGADAGAEGADAGADGADGADAGDNEANAGEDGAQVTLISNANELIGINDDLTGNYELSANIDLSGVNWTPIGSAENPFLGTLNGKGFTISNLTISSGDYEHLGLFGVLGKDSLVLSLKLSNFKVKNSKQTDTCNFKNVYYDEKEVTAKEIHCSSGGLVGFSQGIIDSVEIIGNSLVEGYVNVGGLVGIVGQGYLRKTSSIANVKGLPNGGGGNIGGNIGGLVGYLRGMGAYVTSSYFRGDVNAPGSKNVGGLVGLATGGVAFSYAVANVSRSIKSGLLIGEMDSAGKNRVAHSFASPIDNESDEGSFIGGSSLDGLINVKFATLAVGDHGCSGTTNSDTICTKIALEENAQLKGSNYQFFDFVNTWVAVDGDFPVLRTGGVSKAENDLIQLEGRGTLLEPYLITSPAEFLLLNDAQHFTASYFKIENDLNFTGVNFNPIGLTINGVDVGFSGQIIGNNKTIKNININDQDAGYISMFPYTYGLSIYHLNFDNISVSGRQYVGGITSKASNLIFEKVTMKNSLIQSVESRNGMFCAHCSNIIFKESKIVNGNVQNRLNFLAGQTGLISGEMFNGMINRVYAQGTISGFNRRVGGLVGQKTSFGTTIESAANVNIVLNGRGLLNSDTGMRESGLYVGGLFGAVIDRDYIYDSYAVGSITSENKINVEGFPPKDYFIGGVLGNGYKHRFQNGFSFVNIELDRGEKCGGFSGSQSSTHQAKNFLSASFGKCGTEQTLNGDGVPEERDVPISFIGKGGTYDTGNSNVVVRDFGDGGTLCDHIKDDGTQVEVNDGNIPCQVVENDVLIDDRFSFRGSTQQNNLLDNLLGFGWDSLVWNTNDSGYPTLKWQN